MFIHYFESIPNTNSLLMELSKKSAKNWTVVWTANQTQGRGYAGNRWQAKPNQNIALSLLIINRLSYEELVFFNQWCSVVIANVLKKYTDDVFVKWPNDIILTDKKVCGILIETRKSGNDLYIITGIGLNVNQSCFDYPKAGSLSLKTGLTYDLKELVSDILTAFENNYFLITENAWSEISEKYNSLLFRKGVVSTFKKDGKQFEGVISGADNKGNLIVKMDGSLQRFAHKAVELMY